MKKQISVALSFVLTIVLFSSVLCVATSANDSDFYILDISESDNGTNYALTLSGKISADTYTLRYEDAEGVLSDFDNICKFVVSEDTDEISYSGLILQNCAPENAEYIGVYNGCGERVAFSDVSHLSADTNSEKLYSFAAISDTHIGAKTADSDLQNALTYFENDNDIKFTTICGDLSLAGTENNLNLYKSIVDTYTTKPVYAISGNHETNATFAPLAMDSLQTYTEQDLYYSFTYNDDVYIMMGMYSLKNDAEFAEGELQWLYETLEANRNKRCFLFMHLFPREGSGDAVDLDLEGDMLNNTQGQVFYSLLSHYSNVIYMHGHSHQKFEIQEANAMNTYDNIFGCHSVHIPSLAYPKHISDSKLVSDYDASEGYIIDVYENSIILRGRDFVSGKFLPIAHYSLDTTTKIVEENTYYDITGTISNGNSNVLKAGQSWYDSNFDKSLITKISFINNYPSADYDECWDATMSNSGQVMVYRKGTELFVVGNNGIVANRDSSYLFTDFKNLSQIDGLELVEMKNVKNIDGFFKNCCGLSTVDLTVFDSIAFEKLNEVFKGCSSIKSIDLSGWNLSKVKRYNNTFEGCVLLQNLILGENLSSEHTSIYCVATFKNCASLTDFDFSCFGSKNVYLGSTFYGCTSIKKIDLKNVTPTEFSYTFMGCSNLESIAFQKKVTSIGISAFEKCNKLKYVFYLGSEDDWNKIVFGNNNEMLLNASIHFNAVDHISSDWIIDFEPNCRVDGSMHTECTICGEIIETETLKNDNHIPTNCSVIEKSELGQSGKMIYICSICTEPKEVEYLLGDIDGDNTYTENDYALIIKTSACSFILNEKQIVSADINGDGAVDTFDAIELDLYMNQ